MLRIIFAVLVFLFVVLMPAASMEEAETNIKSDVGGGIPRLYLWHPAHEEMCQKIAEEIGIGNEVAEIQFLRPQWDESGEWWLFSDHGSKNGYQVAATFFPEPIQNLKGEILKDVVSISCYLKPKPPRDPNEFTVRVLSDATERVAKALTP